MTYELTPNTVSEKIGALLNAVNNIPPQLTEIFTRLRSLETDNALKDRDKAEFEKQLKIFEKEVDTILEDLEKVTETWKDLKKINIEDRLECLEKKDSGFVTKKSLVDIVKGVIGWVNAILVPTLIGYIIWKGGWN